MYKDWLGGEYIIIKFGEMEEVNEINKYLIVKDSIWLS